MKGISVIAFVACVAAVSANLCPSDSSYELLLNHPDCSKYYQCTHGALVERDCPATLGFNQDIQACDYLYNIDCSDRTWPDGSNPNGEDEEDVDEETPVDSGNGNKPGSGWGSSGNGNKPGSGWGSSGNGNKPGSGWGSSGNGNKPGSGWSNPGLGRPKDTLSPIIEMLQ